MAEVLTYQNGPGLMVPPSIFRTYLLQSMADIPGPPLPRTLRLLLSEALPYILQTVWLPALWPLGCCAWFLSLPSPLGLPTRFTVTTPLNFLRCVCLWLCLPFIYNKRPLPPSLGAVMSFPVLISFFHSTTKFKNVVLNWGYSSEVMCWPSVLKVLGSVH